MANNEHDEIRIDTSASGTPSDASPGKHLAGVVYLVIGLALVFVVIVLVDQFFGSSSTRPSKLEASVAVPYTVLQDRTVNGGELREVLVRIKRALPEGDVKAIAHEVRRSKGNPGKLSIGFLLPAMEVGKGAWARALFKPDLEVTIFDISVADDAAFRKPVRARGRIIGTWLWVLPSSSRTRTISEENGVYYLTQRFADGDQGEERLVEMEPNRKYARVGDRRGDYMLINGKGQLELWDPEGRIDTLERVGP